MTGRSRGNSYSFDINDCFSKDHNTHIEDVIGGMSKSSATIAYGPNSSTFKKSHFSHGLS